MEESNTKPYSESAETPKRHLPRKTLSIALGIAATDKPAPTDEEVERWREERRMERYGL